MLINHKNKMGQNGSKAFIAGDGTLLASCNRSPNDIDFGHGKSHLSACVEANREQRLMVCDAVIDLAAAFFNVCSKQLRRPGRCVQSISRVRQIAMYISHTGLGLTMTDVGKGFCRDRTTVMHACHQIEDMRDDEEFDRIVEQFNRISIAAFASFLESQ